MATTYDLSGMPAEKRFDHFREFIEEYYVPLDVQCDTPERFNCWRKHESLGPIDIGSSMLAELHVDRTSGHVARTEDDRIKLVVPISGSIAVRQDGNEALVTPGAFYLTDPLRPSEERVTHDMEFAFALLPRDGLVSQAGDIQKITATRFNASMPYAKLAMDYTRSLAGLLDDLHGPAGVSAGAVASDLFKMALWESIDKVCTHTTVHRRAQFERAKAFIDSHLTHYDLSLGKVAAAIGLSTRYVRDLLAEGGLRYRDYVLEKRLAGCQRDLTDPRLTQHSITEICYRWAFYDGAHFSRAFRRMYGMSPRDYRASKV